jgi:hypothetical protein
VRTLPPPVITGMQRGQMSKLDEGEYVFVCIRAELPEGGNTLRKLLSKVAKYRVIRVEERVSYAVYRGRDTPREWELKLWVAREDYQPLANCLGKQSIDPKPTVNRFAPF